MKTIEIDPLTRLEGHGKISVFLDEDNAVTRAFLQVPELRGFEAFCVGRPAVDMPQITSRICGVCPVTHHLVATKTLDQIYGVAPSPTASAIRELVNCAFIAEDHLLHFYILSGPDFFVGPDAPIEIRNMLGVVQSLAQKHGKDFIEIRAAFRRVVQIVGGRTIHPVLGLPGGVAMPIDAQMQDEISNIAAKAVQFVQQTLKLFDEIFIENKNYRSLIEDEAYRHDTYYMGTVDEWNRLSLYDGTIRVCNHRGVEVHRFEAAEYSQFVAEHVEQWSYAKFPYLKQVGWNGFVEGTDSGVYRVAPLARYNVSEGVTTPLAQAEYERMAAVVGACSGQTFANHWARLVETMYCVERLQMLIAKPGITSRNTRNMDYQAPTEGVGAIEAPRGTLFHHYKTDETGIITSCNMIVATQANGAVMNMGIERAARELIVNGQVDNVILNKLEMVFRAYDPCLSCATHALGKTPLRVDLLNNRGTLIKSVFRRE